MFIHDARNPKADALAANLTRALPALAKRDDLVVVLGGDGYLLHTVARLGTAPTYLGLNAGTLGFLLNDVDGREDEVLELLAAQAWSVRAYPLLEARVTCMDGATHDLVAMNDIYLERSTGQTTRLTVRIYGQVVVDPLVADGIIFATALGSTAYTLSAGGLACHPTLHVLCVTPICPHAPRLPPLVLPPDARAEVEVGVPDRRPVRAVADGRAIEDITHVSLGYGTQQVRLALLDGHDFTQAMVRKIL